MEYDLMEYEMNTYKLLDSGHGRKLEIFGPLTLIRPCPQALWEPLCPSLWKTYDGEFVRFEDKGWKKVKARSSFEIFFNLFRFKLELTDFGHVGLFPEHAMHWSWMQEKVQSRDFHFLNLFAYSGAATLALAKVGAQVTHLDASKKMIIWAKDNIRLNGLEKAPVRFIVDDAIKFLKREIKRKNRYHGILLDPPTFGRGTQGQVFKIERDLVILLKLCKEVLISKKGFIVLTTHTPLFTPRTLQHLLKQIFNAKTIEAKEMLISSSTSFSLPSGCYARWHG